jgi:hypothetical protein
MSSRSALPARRPRALRQASQSDSVPHPCRFFLRKGWEIDEAKVYPNSENALSQLHKVHCSRVHAVAQAGWLRPVVKDMAEMGVAAAA